ncbi:hypothetical protein MTO96_038573, partial [Rhipicephalus appendiculatus]
MHLGYDLYCMWSWHRGKRPPATAVPTLPDPALWRVRGSWVRSALRCEAVGAPAPRLRLLKDDQPLTNWTSLRLVHVLSNIGLSQAGAYQCLAKNTAGAVLSAKAKLQVAHLTPTEEVSEPVHVTATAIWSRLDGTPLDSRKFATTQDNRLVILEATAQLEGKYQVELTNPHTGDTIFGPEVELSVDSSGEYKAELSIVVPPADRQFNNLGNGYDSYLECIAAGRPACFGSPTVRTTSRRPPIVAHANVTVSVMPSLSRKVDEETAVELGQQVQLPCAAEGHPPPEVHWLLDAHPLDMSRRPLPPARRRHPGDSGTGHGRRGRLPVRGREPAGRSASRHLAPRQNCRALLWGAPLPNTSWTYSDVVPVHSEGRMQILESGTLVIASVVLADSGKYTCVRANSAGSASAEAYLTVL